MNELNEQVNEYLAQIKKAQSELSDKAEKAIRNFFDEIMKQSPYIEALSWNQYTPYFMDGETCVFSVNDLNIHFKNYTEVDESFMYPQYYKSTEESRENLARAYNTTVDNIADEIRNHRKIFRKLVDGDSLDLFRLVFGDHVEVTYSNGKFIKDHYDHD